jgi:predicted NBD/HSP70 family sugar kinase
MYILFDIGGTKTRIAASNDLTTLVDVRKYDTPARYSEGIETLCKGIEELAGGKAPIAIAGGIRGPLNHEKTGIISDTVLIDWVGRPLVKDLSTHFGTNIYLENDTAVVGLGEVHFGAGKGYSIVAYHTVSTGVGGARFVDGRIDVTSIGFEPGHQTLDIDQTILGRHIPPTLGNLVSGESLEKHRGVKPYEIPQTDHVWDELAYYLAHGLKNTIVYWSPDVIVLGGSMIVGNPRILLEDITRHTKEVLGNLVPCPLIVDAKLKDEGGLYGAMALIRMKITQSNTKSVNS